MVAIQGLGGVQEPKHERPNNVRGRKTDDTAKGEKVQDGVSISDEAQSAASVAKAMQVAKASGDIRQELVEAARERIERGDYKEPEIVREVAKKVSKYLP